MHEQGVKLDDLGPGRLVRGGLVGETDREGDRALSDDAHAKTGDRLGENRMGNGLSWRSCFDWIALTPNPATGFGENRMGNGLSWRFRKKKRESRQNRRLAGDLGKFEWEPVYHGHHAFFRWRSRQNRRRVWENSNGNSFIMAIPQGKTGIAPKPATRSRAAWENFSGTRLSWPSSTKARSDW